MGAICFILLLSIPPFGFRDQVSLRKAVQLTRRDDIFRRSYAARSLNCESGVSHQCEGLFGRRRCYVTRGLRWGLRRHDNH